MPGSSAYQGHPGNDDFAAVIKPSILASLCCDIYDSSKKDEWLHYWDQDGGGNDLHVAHTKIDDTDILVFRGTESLADWIADVEAWPTYHRQLGFLHFGFALYADAILEETTPLLGGRVVITGHSLGGARARILAAHRIVNNLPVDQVCVFGSPKPGFANVSRVIQKSGIVHTSFRNRNDPVPLVPGILPMWVHSEDWTVLDAAPAESNLEALRDHSSSLYLAGSIAWESTTGA